jgi:apolipoprotein N-acyltransferase
LYYLKYPLSFIAGVIATLAFAPVNIWWLAILSPLVLLRIWRNTTGKQAFILGWVYGLGFFGFGIRWVYSCFYDFGFTPAIYSLLLFLLFVVILAVFSAIPGLILRHFYTTYTARALCIGFPCAWVICEWIRSWLWTGFPWLLMGYSQINTPLKNYAPIVSVYGVSFLLMLSVSLCYMLFASINQSNRSKSLILCSLLAIWFSAYALQKINWVKFKASHTVSIVQPNLTPYVKTKLSLEDHASVYMPITNKNLNAELIVWPEGSLPYMLPYSQPILDRLDQLGKENNNTFIVGAANSIAGSDNFHNSLIAVGKGSGVYHKQHLVPFWEYLPFQQYLSKIQKFMQIKRFWYESGTATQDPLHIPGLTILPVICFEISFPEEVRKSLVATNGSVIINISEDGWFADSWGAAQNFDVMRMRALETGRYIVRASTSGISAIIDNKGDIIAASQKFKAQALLGEFRDAQGFTPWTYLGTRFFMPLLFLLWLGSLQLGLGDLTRIWPAPRPATKAGTETGHY